jgi:hypothetical protein
VVGLNVKYLMVALGSASIGYFVAQSRCEKYFKQELMLCMDEHDAVVKALKESYEEQIAELIQHSKADWKIAEPEVDSEETEHEDALGENLESIAAAASALTAYSGGVIQYNKVTLAATPDVDAVAASAQEATVQTVVKKFERVAEVVEPEPAEDGVITMPAVDEDTPFVITEESYLNEEAGYKQYALTYFAGDNVLAGESDNKIDDDFRRDVLGSAINDILIAGPAAMNGENTVYVRNVPLQREFEIAWRDSKYSFEVGESTE